MSYVPPHARNNNKTNKLVVPTKKVVQNDFPELVKPQVTNKKPALDFSKLFDENAEPTIKPEEMKRGLIKLTKNGIVDSLSTTDREEDDKLRDKQIVSKNMIDYSIMIEQRRKKQLALDDNYVPEEVINEYSSSDSSYYSTEESELNEEPDDETDEL
jgi:hypothetical protein